MSPVVQQTPLPDGCLSFGTNQIDCATRSKYSPENPWNSEFQLLRGFFISDHPSPDNSSLLPGSLLGSTKIGTMLYPQTRVYNCSLKAMDLDTTVHVRFYAQPWDVGRTRRNRASRVFRSAMMFFSDPSRLSAALGIL